MLNYVIYHNQNINNSNILLIYLKNQYFLYLKVIKINMILLIIKFQVLFIYIIVLNELLNVFHIFFINKLDMF